MSRSSSGFESSHLPSPEYPALPLTLISTRSTKILLPSKPQCQPVTLLSLRPNNILSLLSTEKGCLPSAGICRSQSCMELRRNPAAEKLRRCFSLTDLHKVRKRKLIDTSSKTEGTSQHTVHQKNSKITFPSFESSVTSYDAVYRTSNIDTGNVLAPKHAETTQSTHLNLSPTVTAEKSSRDINTSPLPNSNHEPSCMYKCTDHMSYVYKSGGSLSASSEANRLKMRRIKKTSMKTVNLGSVMEERPQLQDINLKKEPPLEKVLPSNIQ